MFGKTHPLSGFIQGTLEAGSYVSELHQPERKSVSVDSLKMACQHKRKISKVVRAGDIAARCRYQKKYVTGDLHSAAENAPNYSSEQMVFPEAGY